MPESPQPGGENDVIEVDLKNPIFAAVLAWLWPGAGHFYQGRWPKGVLFMVCILSTFFYGLAIGGGHVVYASWSKNDRRWHYICQAGVGLPAMPALLQARAKANGDKLPFGNLMAPPSVLAENQHDELADWHDEYHSYFELGTLFTMIAGLLNVLAVYDAAAGPFVPPPAKSKESGEPPPDPPKDPDEKSDKQRRKRRSNR